MCDLWSGANVDFVMNNTLRWSSMWCALRVYRCHFLPVSVPLYAGTEFSIDISVTKILTEDVFVWDESLGVLKTITRCRGYLYEPYDVGSLLVNAIGDWWPVYRDDIHVPVIYGSGGTRLIACVGTGPFFDVVVYFSNSRLLYPDLLADWRHEPGQLSRMSAGPSRAWRDSSRTSYALCPCQRLCPF